MSNTKRLLEYLVESHNISIGDAREMMKSMTFMQYTQMVTEAGTTRANIPSPSGNAQIGGDNSTVVPAGPAGPSGTRQPVTPAGASPRQTTPPANQNNPQEDPTNQDEPPADPNQPDKVDPNVPNSDKQVNPFNKSLNAAKALFQSVDQSDLELNAILELAGLREVATTGATGAASIATGVTPMGELIKRNGTETKVMKSTQGNTSPNSATGKLSRMLVDRNLKTTTRKNNGE